MNRLNLWASKYHISPAILWAMAILGLIALMFVLFAFPAYLGLVGDARGELLSLALQSSPTPLWYWVFVVGYVAIVVLVLLSPLLVAWPREKQPAAQKTAGQASADLEEQNLRRQSLISTMAAGTIQEIRSPLTAARGFVQLISNLPVDSELTKEYSEYALMEMDRIEQLLQEYMLLSNAVAPKSEPVSLLDIAHDAYQMMEAVMAERNIRVSFEGSEPACILGDPFYLQQVLNHLLFNAAEATPAKGRVAIELNSNEKEVFLAVSDTGMGMSTEEMEHCFDPFYSTKESGTGLGLAICQRMITDMQGRIEVSSKPEAGTTFTVAFPLCSDDCNMGK